MIRKIPKELGKEYSKLSQEERKQLWVNLVSEKLGISEEEAKGRIDRNNSLPKWEILDGSGNQLYPLKPEHRSKIPPTCQKVYPRFNSNAMLLAQLSKDYEGPRGPRPIFVSLENIVRISLLNEPRQINYWRKNLVKYWYHPAEALTELKLTTSEPNSAPEGVEFSLNDIRRGVYIPTSLKEQTMKAFGIIYAKGYILKNEDALRITGTMRNKEFYENVVIRTIEEAFNLLQDEIYNCSEDSHFSGNKYNYLRLAYGSKALTTYLLNNLKFPGSENEKKETGISEKIKGNKYIEEFLKFYLACNAVFNISDNLQKIHISIYDVSKPILEDIKEILLKRIKKPSIALLPSTRDNSYILRINTIPTFELYFLNLLNENPRVKGKVESYLKEYGIGKRAFKHLYRLFGESVVPYRRGN